MGFGFNLFVVFILLPLTFLLLLGWGVTQRKIFGQLVGALWLALVSLVAFSAIVSAFSKSGNLEKEDYYGWYVIDRKFFPGQQADWQYNSLRFKVTPSDSIYFYVTDKARILQVYRGRISITTSYPSARLVLNMEQPTYHVVADNPTTYRGARQFNLVFYSRYFNNVYFKKGEWEPLPE
jgi:hypothetical protein